MARRLELAARRAEIIARTSAMIAEGRAHDLSMRAVARECGMSAPGVMHHFPHLRGLVETVLRQRDEQQAREIRAALVEGHPDPTLYDLTNVVVRYYADRPEETRNFDAFEAEALSPSHPAHDYYVGSALMPWDVTRSLIAKEYTNVDDVVAILSLIVDGLRSRWLREGTPDYWADWVRVRDLVFASFARASDS